MSINAIENKLNNIFCCNKCFGGLTYGKDGDISCSSCSQKIKIKSDIPVFTEKEKYWCNFPKETMEELNKAAETDGCETALRKIIKDKEIREYIVEEGRVDPLFFLPVTKESVVLDVGCKWGGLTVPFSDYCKQIVGIDTTYETIKFLDIRKRELKKENISLAVASALNLPFKECSFDVVILNGVLEWLGYDDNFDATKDYGKKRDALNVKKSKPDDMQKKSIKEIFRVLKPGGALFIGIENRFDLNYFFGALEDHTNLKYISLMPRFLANLYMKLKLKQEFRTYTYSMPALRTILKKIGFGKIEFLTAFNSYREPDYIFSLEDPRLLRYFLENHRKNNSKNFFKRAVWKLLVKMNIYKFLVPSFLIIAQKAGRDSH